MLSKAREDAAAFGWEADVLEALLAEVRARRHGHGAVFWQLVLSEGTRQKQACQTNVINDWGTYERRAASAFTTGGFQPGTGPLSAVCRTVSDPPPLYSSVERLSHEGLAGVAHLGACREK